MNKIIMIFALVGVCMAQYSSNGYSSSAGSRSSLSGQYSARGGNGNYANGRSQTLSAAGYSQYASAGGVASGLNGQSGYGSNGAYRSGQYGRQGDLDTNEPARYEFKYDVNVPEYAVEFGHEEQRDGDNTNGAYYVLLPDGRRQLVEYTADLDGYHPRISYTESAGSSRASGYQGNAYGSQGSYQRGSSSNGAYQNGGGYQNGGSYQTGSGSLRNGGY